MAVVASISSFEKRSRRMISSVICALTDSCPLKRMRPVWSRSIVGGLPRSWKSVAKTRGTEASVGQERKHQPRMDEHVAFWMEIRRLFAAF